MLKIARGGMRVAPALLIFGCSLDWTPPTKAETGITADASTSPDASTATDAANATTDASNLPAGHCMSNADCSGDELCTSTRFDCGSKPGLCAPRNACAAGDPPTGATYCACDGATYRDPCLALAKRVDLAICGPTEWVTAGYASCPASAILIIDLKLPRERQYRCETSTCDGECPCLLETYCLARGGECHGTVVECLPE